MRLRLRVAGREHTAAQDPRNSRRRTSRLQWGEGADIGAAAARKTIPLAAAANTPFDDYARDRATHAARFSAGVLIEIKRFARPAS